MKRPRVILADDHTLILDALKNSAAAELQNAIREVVRGGFYVTPLMTKGMDGSFVQNFKLRKSTSPLTLRQKEVLQLLAEGRSMKAVSYTHLRAHETPEH